jgi:hypothetical protein
MFLAFFGDFELSKQHENSWPTAKRLKRPIFNLHFGGLAGIVVLTVNLTKINQYSVQQALLANLQFFIVGGSHRARNFNAKKIDPRIVT